MDAAIGTALALLASLACSWLTRTLVMPPDLQVLGAYLAVWAPLAATVLVASVARGSRSLVRDFGLRFRWIDLLWGIGAGLIARATVSLVELAGSGRIAGLGVRLELPDGFAFWFGVILAPIVLGPFIEEVFFRGLALRAVEREVGSGIRRPVAAVVSVVIVSLVFALLHVAQATTVGEAWRLGAGSLVLGLAAGALTVLTGRLGGAIVAHAVFNGALIAAVLTA